MVCQCISFSAFPPLHRLTLLCFPSLYRLFSAASGASAAAPSSAVFRRRGPPSFQWRGASATVFVPLLYRRCSGCTVSRPSLVRPLPPMVLPPLRRLSPLPPPSVFGLAALCVPSLLYPVAAGAATFAAARSSVAAGPLPSSSGGGPLPPSLFLYFTDAAPSLVRPLPPLVLPPLR
eukprot:4153283-Pleurochrysis_carterae.AAC.1